MQLCGKNGETCSLNKKKIQIGKIKKILTIQNQITKKKLKLNYKQEMN